MTRGTARSIERTLHSEYQELGRVEIEKVGLFRRNQWMIYSDRPLPEDLVLRIIDYASRRV